MTAARGAAYTCIMTQVSKQSQPRKPMTPKQASARPGPVDRLLDAELFKGLCDPTRLQLLACLAKCGRGCSVSEVAGCCSVDLSVVSRHLSLLERAGIVESAKKGRVVTYTVRYADVCGRLRALADAINACCPAGAACADGKGCGCG